MKLFGQKFKIEAGKAANQHFHDLALGASAILQAKIIEDLENKADHLNSSSELFFDSRHLIFYTNSQPNDYPSMEKLYKFIYNLYQFHHFGIECCIYMLFLVLKFLKESKIPLFRKNWKEIVTIATLISQKVTIENHLCNYEFSLFFDDLTDDVLYEMEKDYLNFLNLCYEINEQKYEAVFDLLKSAFDVTPNWEIDYDNLKKIVERSKELTMEAKEVSEEDQGMIRRVETIFFDDYII